MVLVLLLCMVNLGIMVFTICYLSSRINELRDDLTKLQYYVSLKNFQQNKDCTLKKKLCEKAKKRCK